jgi:hypothetical protein
MNGFGLRKASETIAISEHNNVITGRVGEQKRGTIVVLKLLGKKTWIYFIKALRVGREIGRSGVGGGRAQRIKWKQIVSDFGGMSV